MPSTTVFLAVALLGASGLVALVFVGPIFAVAVPAVAALVFCVIAALAARPGSGVSAAERPRALGRFAWILFLLAVIASVSLQAYLYWSPDGCLTYDWLDGTVDGRCNPLIHGIAGTDAGLPSPVDHEAEPAPAGGAPAVAPGQNR